MDYVWYLLAAVGAVIGVALAYRFLGVEKVKRWLLWAVTDAEMRFGGGTGELKLAYVYDLFAGKFPKLQAVMPYGLFCKLTDVALATMRTMLENEDIGKLFQKGK